MNIFAIGDVVGTQGCEFLRRHLSSIKKLRKIDLCICNGENSAAGNGINPCRKRIFLTAEWIYYNW
jgi:calcineurin-like phosphoesterase